MKIGISSACFYPDITEDAITKCHEVGVELCEIFINADCELENDYLFKIKNMVDSYGIKVKSIHPYSSVFEPFMIFSRYLRRFEDSREYYKRFYNAANLLGANYVVLHGGHPGAHTTDEEYCGRLSKMRKDANEFGVTLCQENVNKFRSASPEFITKIRQQLNDDIDFVYDIKQCVRAGVDPKVMYNAMKDKIVHVHINDYDNSNDCLLPGKGVFNYQKFFNKLKEDNYKGDAVVEVYNNAYNNLNEISNSINMLNNLAN